VLGHAGLQLLDGTHGGGARSAGGLDGHVPATAQRPLRAKNVLQPAAGVGEDLEVGSADDPAHRPAPVSLRRPETAKSAPASKASSGVFARQRVVSARGSGNEIALTGAEIVIRSDSFPQQPGRASPHTHPRSFRSAKQTSALGYGLTRCMQNPLRPPNMNEGMFLAATGTMLSSALVAVFWFDSDRTYAVCTLRDRMM